MQHSSIFRITQFRCFYRFTVNLRFASAAFFAPIILSCIRYPAVPVCKKCAKVCRAPEKGKSHEESYDSSWDFGALEGTRIPGPLIKRIQGASFVKFQKFEEALFLSYHRKTRLCTHRIVCIQCNDLQPLSRYSGVQKVCKNVQTGKTKPNGQINHRFYGRV